MYSVYASVGNSHLCSQTDLCGLFGDLMGTSAMNQQQIALFCTVLFGKCSQYSCILVNGVC